MYRTTFLPQAAGHGHDTTLRNVNCHLKLPDNIKQVNDACSAMVCNCSRTVKKCRIHLFSCDISDSRHEQTVLSAIGHT